MPKITHKRPRASQAPAESQVSKRNTRIKRRIFCKDFWGYFDGRSDMYSGFFSEFLNFWIELSAILYGIITVSYR